MKNLLFIEDGIIFKQIIKVFLCDYDNVNHIFFADNLEETMEILKKNKIDIIFIDVMLSNSNLDGIDIAKELYKYKYKMFFLTCCDQISLGEMLIKKKFLNNIKVLYKPLSKTQYLDIINNC